MKAGGSDGGVGGGALYLPWVIEYGIHRMNVG